MNYLLKALTFIFCSVLTFIPLVDSFSQAESEVKDFKSIEEVISGIDSLLGDIKQNSISRSSENSIFPSSSANDNQEGSFRVQNELMPGNLIPETEQSSVGRGLSYHPLILTM